MIPVSELLRVQHQTLEDMSSIQDLRRIAAAKEGFTLEVLGLEDDFVERQRRRLVAVGAWVSSSFVRIWYEDHGCWHYERPVRKSVQRVCWYSWHYRPEWRVNGHSEALKLRFSLRTAERSRYAVLGVDEPIPKAVEMSSENPEHECDTLVNDWLQFHTPRRLPRMPQQPISALIKPI